MATSASDVSRNYNILNNNNNAVGNTISGFSSYLDKIVNISNSNTAKSEAMAKEQRDWQERQNKIAMDFNLAEAQKNRDWQEYMSSTAHQREVADLKAAGLNPVLSATGGNGAAVTSGATASGVTSAGSKGEVDTSANVALVGLLGSLLSAQTQLESQRLSAQTNLAVADKYNAMSKYAAELGAATGIEQSKIAANATLGAAKIHGQATLNSANIQATAQKYVADKHLEGAQAQAAAMKIAATLNSNAQKYGYRLNASNQKAIAELNAEVNKELKQMGIDAQFDFAEQYPSNEWQASPGQAQARAWIDTIAEGLRDLGIGANNISQIVQSIMGSSSIGQIGF